MTEEERRNNASTRVVLASSTGETERYVLVDVLPETAAEKNLCDTALVIELGEPTEHLKSRKVSF